MYYFRGLFKGKKKESRRRALSLQRARHHDASLSDDKVQEEHMHPFAEPHIEQTSFHHQEVPSSSESSEDLPQQTTSDPEHLSEVHACQTSAPEQQPPLHEGLQPAYRYTCGEFSETILREESMLARQYNFSSPSDRIHAEATASATRRSVRDSRNGEFDSIYMQFMHGTADQ